MKNSCLILLFILLSGCRTSHLKNNNQNNFGNKIPIREHSIQSVLWQQHSAEYKALCHQAFNLAQLQLDNILLQKNKQGKPLAIITDIDETLLNNSPFNAKLIETDKNYSKENWIKWGLLEKATPIPGSLEFFKYAESKGVQIFYISNRYLIQEKETKKNLIKLGFPFIDQKHILLREKTSGKQERRQEVLKENSVIMLIGDNLSDFDDLFDNKPTSERNKIVDNLRNKFGKEFIVLPNPMYGDWETKGIYEGNYNWSSTQKDSIRRVKLISY
ncbi:5'-nucleotidase [Dokdonia pacifica]|uniref:5'-nucleotidase, lipoprotein e(P4) family n=1 Tax=Dokdonia pacifica TaxID=1627892 RepID=A0A239AH57_9FLAO|nr:5'-nucleotidase, lipoprotein e(P4) family [Dokdonia pacifica]GGG37448.1 5'-nucleotidase [Dokdonia pacifica]SNR95006.1 5'-nucleotidase, lipoprotein e(P4) family [Dokdonia pacifica]